MAEVAAPATEELLFPHLKRETQHHHRRLEGHLGLLNPPVLRERFARVLKGFVSFHRAWEPAIREYPRLAALLASRSRVAHAERDLLRLGESDATVAQLAACPLQPELLADEARAFGSLYVMEGSTLGAEVIGRVLAAQPWVPEGRLYYFTPPGRNVRTDWMELQQWAQRRWPRASWPRIAAGARGTFDLLDGWLGGEHLG